MKLKALCRISGVKVISRTNRKQRVKPGKTEKDNVAFAGDIYEGPESHIKMRIAEAYQVDHAGVADDDTDKGGEGGSAKGADKPDIKALKAEAKKLGATEEQLKAAKSVKAVQALIEALGEGAGTGTGGDDNDLGLD